jgi:mannose-1-phosphate guanylyltransferase
VELQEYFPLDDAGNCLAGGPIVHDVRDSIVYNAAGAERMAVGVVGVKGLAVVVTEDAVLVIPKARAQEVRCVVEQLKARNARQV